MNGVSTTWRGLDLALEIAAGSSTREIADAAGSTPGGVRAALWRRGLSPVPRCPVTIRSTAEEMPPRQGIEYLLGIIEQIAPVFSAEEHPVDAWGVSLTPSQRIIAGILYDRCPHAVTKAELYDILYSTRADGEFPGLEVIGTLVQQLRKRLPESAGSIVNHWGRGYAFQKPAGDPAAGAIS